jgi:hypothetical protein
VVLSCGTSIDVSDLEARPTSAGLFFVFYYLQTDIIRLLNMFKINFSEHLWIEGQTAAVPIPDMAFCIVPFMKQALLNKSLSSK